MSGMSARSQLAARRSVVGAVCPRAPTTLQRLCDAVGRTLVDIEYDFHFPLAVGALWIGVVPVTLLSLGSSPLGRHRAVQPRHVA